MSMKHVTTKASLDADSAGTLRAVFSTFGVVDHGNDVVLASAFRDGQQVPLTWAHDWTKPIGKGTIRVEPDRAIFDGQFNLGTSWGRDAYEAVKFAGPLQEFSWGFKVTDSEPADVDGQRVRLIKGADIFEVSPVLLGEGLGTHTLDVKRSEIAPPHERHGSILVTTADSFNPLPYADHAEAMLSAFQEFAARTRARTDMRAKEGRALSAANRGRITALLSRMREAMADVEELLASTDPTPPDPEPDKSAFWAELERASAARRRALAAL